MKFASLSFMMVSLYFVGCAATNQNSEGTTVSLEEQWALPPRLTEALENDGGRCNLGTAETHEISEYDTTGDNIPDVRKVFRRIHSTNSERLVLSCRELDLNTDGVKDLFRFYDDEGEALREEADRNFDGIIEEISYFENRVVILRELDTNGDGEIDTKWHYNKFGILKAESDASGKSSSTAWEPNQWAYFENGEVTRMGEDVDDDGHVDLWDRKPVPAQAENAEETPTEEEAAEESSENEEAVPVEE